MISELVTKTESEAHWREVDQALQVAVAFDPFADAAREVLDKYFPVREAA